MKFHGIYKLLLLCWAPASAQITWVSRGAETIINPLARVYISGDLLVDSTSRFHHSGVMSLDGNLNSKGKVLLKGDISLSGNIENGGEISALSGSFDFRGGAQTISGEGTTSLYILKLSGSGIKTLKQHVKTEKLDLNDRILHTSQYHLYIKQDNEFAISRLNGYVSSDSGGALIRPIAPGKTYLFPLGDQQTYAPVMAVPSFSPDTVAMRFVMQDAGQDILSRNFVPAEICRSNSVFYHLLQRSDTSLLTIQMYTPAHLATKFNTGLSVAFKQGLVWNRNEPFTLSLSDTFYRAETQTRDEYEKVFILAQQRPDPPLLILSDSVCMDEKASVVVEPQTGISWIVSGGEIDQTGGLFSFFGASPGSGFVSATQTDSTGCSSFPTGKSIEVLPRPIVSIGVDLPEYAYEDQAFRLYFTGTGATVFNWFEGLLPAGSDSSLFLSFSAPGIYPVSLLVFNEFGCSSRLDTSLTVLAGLEFPDSFSPNGDGINDELHFLNSGIHAFHISIYNRWGVLVFNSRDPKFSWNGRDKGGELLPSGTYFYTLEAELSDQRTYRNKGSITLLN
jgi:gliding motility-associated-like protein